MTAHTLLDLLQWLLIGYLAFWKGRLNLRVESDPDRIDIAHRPDIYNRHD